MSAAEYFTGFFRIAQDVNTLSSLNEYITKYEKKYLIDLFGYDLYLLFIADIDSGTGLPTSSRFLTVYNYLHYSDSNGDITFIPSTFNMSSYAINYRKKQVATESEGISTMLKGFVFFHFVSEMDLSVTPVGVVVNKNENSDRADAKTLEFIEARFNNSVDSFKVIQNYMKGNSSVYPEFDGKELSKVSWGGAF